MHRSRKIINRAATQALLATGLFARISLGQAIPAFPGADGAGAGVSGGRGGIVYHVTRLDTKAGDSGLGTFQYGANDSNFINPDGTIANRTIVFDVGGTIFLGLNNEVGHPGSSLNGWDTTSTVSIGSNVTVAGQTAPGGINIVGGQVKINGDRRAPIPVSPNANDIIRNVTIGAGYGLRKANSTSGYYDFYTLDAMDVNSNGVMVDHVSGLFATDETISANEGANHTTIQYTSMSQGQSYPQADAQDGGKYKNHAMGSLWGIGSSAVTTFSHNLYAHQATRIPTPQTVSSLLATDGSGNPIPGYTDFRNNVVYNWMGNAGYGSSGEPGSINFANNYYKVGPGGDTTSGNAIDFGIKPGIGGTTVFSGSSSTQVYQNGGNVRLNLNGTSTTLANSNFGSAAFSSSPNPAAATYVGLTDTASAAFTNVLNYVGANWNNRSAIDARIVSQVANGTGKMTALDDATNGYNSAGQYVTNSSDTEWNKLLALRATSNGGIGGTGIYARAANFDSDGDGMPDTWEIAHGLNPAVADNNGDFDSDGYTNLEEYINELAEWPAPKPLIFNAATNARYEQITNWDIKWEPSRYDEAQIPTGNVTLDSIGQHARVLKIAPNTGNVAQLSVTGGLKVEEQLSIGAGGQVIQSAGSVTTPVLDVQGAYRLNGGQLNVAAVQLSGAGLLKLASGGGKTLWTSTISVLNTAKLDVTDNQLIVTGMSLGDWNGTAYTGVTGLVAKGRNGGGWNGSGIITSQSAAASPSILTTLAVATAAQAGYAGGTFGGYPVVGSDVLVMYTYAGDANLDARLNADDYFQIDSHYGKTGAANLGYANGDFNYSGTIDGDDYFIIDSNFVALQNAPLPGAASASPVAVPEPAAIAFLAIAVMYCRRRRPS